MKLINQHNLTAIEVHKINLTLRRLVAVLSIYISLIKIITLYVLSKSNDLIGTLLTEYFLILLLTFALVMTYLFSRKINSVNQNHLVYSIVCNYKMEFSVKLKVKLI